jgi:hypothetical protein
MINGHSVDYQTRDTEQGKEGRKPTSRRGHHPIQFWKGWIREARLLICHLLLRLLHEIIRKDVADIYPTIVEHRHDLCWRHVQGRIRSHDVQRHPDPYIGMVQKHSIDGM